MKHSNPFELLKRELIIDKKLININKVRPHENYIISKLKSLKEYYKTFDEIIIPSIIVCSKSKTIIDGHHRYNALKSLKINKIPITEINYNSDKIITNLKNSISKKKDNKIVHIIII